MGPGDGLIWRPSGLPKQSSAESKSISTITARMQRDFTYIDDIVEGLVRVVDRPQSGHRLYNIGHCSPVGLMDFIHAMEQAFGKRARRRFMPMQPGDVLATHADAEAFCEYTGFRPNTSMVEGVARFANWVSRLLRSYDSRKGRIELRGNSSSPNSSNRNVMAQHRASDGTNRGRFARKRDCLV